MIKILRINLLITLFLFLSNTNVYSGYYRYRRWSRIDWSKEDTSNLLLYTIICLVVFIFLIYGSLIILRIKNKKANKLLEKISAKDPFWNKEKLMDYSGSLFKEIQTAISIQNLNPVKQNISSELFSKFSQAISAQKRRNIYLYVDNIKIEKLKIIGIEDFGDNDKDKFAVYLKGKMKSVMMRKGFVPREEPEADTFENIYHFKRENDAWILDEITDSVDTWDLTGLRIREET